MHNIKDILAKLFLLCCSIILLLICLEIIAKIYLEKYASEERFLKYASYKQLMKRYGNNGRIYTPNRHFGYYLTTNYQRLQNKHNAQGYRGDDITMPKPKGEYRIVCVGGSTTYTTGVDDYHYAYPFLLQTYLHEIGYNHIKVINAGVPGWGTLESLINFETRILDLDPDLLIVYHALNDIIPRLVWPKESYLGDNSGAFIPSQDRSSCNLILDNIDLLRVLLIHCGKLLSASDMRTNVMPARSFYGDEFDNQVKSGTYPSGYFTKIPISKMLAENEPRYFRRNIENLIAIARDRHINVLLSTFAYHNTILDSFKGSWDTEEFRKTIDQHNNVLIQISKYSSVPLFDFARFFPKDIKYYQRFKRFGREHLDLYHVNEEGSKLKAKMFAEYLVNNGLITK
jgi:hypothetical protein